MRSNQVDQIDQSSSEKKTADWLRQVIPNKEGAATLVSMPDMELNAQRFIQGVDMIPEKGRLSRFQVPRTAIIVTSNGNTDNILDQGED